MKLKAFMYFYVNIQGVFKKLFMKIINKYRNKIKLN